MQGHRLVLKVEDVKVEDVKVEDEEVEDVKSEIRPDNRYIREFRCKRCKTRSRLSVPANCAFL